MAVGHCYHALPLPAYSPSDFTVRVRERQGDYMALIGELREVYSERPEWLRLQGADASRHIPVAYISEEDWIGRGYVTMELADDQCIICDADDGSFDFTHIGNVFPLGIDHASVLAFCSRVIVAGVQPRAGSMWSQEVCSVFREKVMSSPISIQMELIREGTVLAQARCNADGFFLDAWLAFDGYARLSSNRGMLYPYLEEELDVL